MKVHDTSLPDVKVLEPQVFTDGRGFFLESYNKRTFAEAVGFTDEFVQDNHSRSSKNILRGLHYQLENVQGKLLRVVTGTIYDVVVDMRKSSPAFGKWAAFTLSSEKHTLLWVPPGFAHGFLVVSDYADVLYKTTNFYDPLSERCLIWNDPDLKIPWPLKGDPLISSKDSQGKKLRDLEVYP